VRPSHLVERQLVETEDAVQEGDLGGSGVTDVEPETVPAVAEQLTEPLDVHFSRRAPAGGVDHQPHRSHGASFWARSSLTDGC